MQRLSYLAPLSLLLHQQLFFNFSQKDLLMIFNSGLKISETQTFSMNRHHPCGTGLHRCSTEEEYLEEIPGGADRDICQLGVADPATPNLPVLPVSPLNPCPAKKEGSGHQGSRTRSLDTRSQPPLTFASFVPMEILFPC